MSTHSLLFLFSPLLYFSPRCFPYPRPMHRTLLLHVTAAQVAAIRRDCLPLADTYSLILGISSPNKFRQLCHAVLRTGCDVKCWPRLHFRHSGKSSRPGSQTAHFSPPWLIPKFVSKYTPRMHTDFAETNTSPLRLCSTCRLSITSSNSKP